MDPTVYVWQGGQLVNATALPQFNHTTGANTSSIQITNNSDVALIFSMERQTPVTILARYRLTAPAQPNSQYSISIAANQTGTTDTTQYVTLTESDLDQPFSIEPLNTNVIPIGLRYLQRFASSIAGTQITVNTLPTDRSVVIVMPQQTPTGGYTVNVTTFATPGVPSTQVETYAQSNIQGGSVIVAPIVPTINAQWTITVYGQPAINDGGIVYVSPEYSPTITGSPSTVIVQNVAGRYLGSQSLGSTQTYTITTNEQALIVFTPSGTIIGGLTVVGHTTAVIALSIANPVTSGVYVAYVNPNIETTWDVSFGSSAGTSQGFVLTDVNLPLVDIARLGQQVAADSIPVVLSSDVNGPINVNQWGGTNVSAASSTSNNVALGFIAPKVAAIGYLLNAAGTNVNMLRAPTAGDGFSADIGMLMIHPAYYDSTNNNYIHGRGTVAGGHKVAPTPATLLISNASGANSGMTVTIPAAGTGLYHYITHLRISRTDATSGSVSGSGRLGISTTNLNGLAFGVGNEIPAGGEIIDVDWDLSHALRSQVSNTASTIVLPAAGTGVWWEVTVIYYTDFAI